MTAAGFGKRQIRQLFQWDDGKQVIPVDRQSRPLKVRSESRKVNRNTGIGNAAALFSTTHLRGPRLTSRQSTAYASPTAQISPSLFKLSEVFRVVGTLRGKTGETVRAEKKVWAKSSGGSS
jgi:hypothetical protein